MSATIAKRMLWMLVGVGSVGCASPWTAPNSAPMQQPPPAGVATTRWRAYEGESSETRAVAAPRVGSVAASSADVARDQSPSPTTTAESRQPSPVPSPSPLDARSAEPADAATYETYALEEDATDYMVPLMQTTTADSGEPSADAATSDYDLVARAAAAADEFDRMFVGRLRSAELQGSAAPQASGEPAPLPADSTAPQSQPQSQPATQSRQARAVEAAEAFAPVEESARREQFQDAAGVIWTSPSRGSTSSPSRFSDDSETKQNSEDSLPAAPDPWLLLEDK